jgi:integrase
LTALSKEELGLACWSEFDADLTLFTVPTERVKLKGSTKLTKKLVYKVPLVPLAQRIVHGLRRDGERLFPGLKADKIAAKLVKLGAPKDFKLHVFRHSVATWLQNSGRSEWEVGLVLNHSGSGSVTSIYSHGLPLDLKREMLAQWAQHIERLVAGAEGVARLR